MRVALLLVALGVVGACGGTTSTVGTGTGGRPKDAGSDAACLRASDIEQALVAKARQDGLKSPPCAIDPAEVQQIGPTKAREYADACAAYEAAANECRAPRH